MSAIGAALDGAHSSYCRLGDDKEAALRDEVTAPAAESPAYGYRRLTALLHRQGWAVNHKHVRRIMGDLGLQREIKRRRRETTDSHHPFPRYPNLMTGLLLQRPDQVSAADINYVRMGQGFVYLDELMHVFTRNARLEPG